MASRAGLERRGFERGGDAVKLVVLGLGFSAEAFVRLGAGRFASVTATVRDPARAIALSRDSLTVLPFSGAGADPHALAALKAAIIDADALLVSIPAEDGGDPALPMLEERIRTAPRLSWIGYLSTVGVYGDHQGATVDETAALNATSRRGLNRIAAERGWLTLGAHIFRLAGIYGPGRNQLVGLRQGWARRIIKQGQVFSRIHAEDIAGVCLASLDRPNPGAIYNVADNEPAPPQDVIAYAASLLGIDPPPEEPFETAEMTPMARSFYLDSRRIDNARVREELGYRFRYPTYREGLAALHAAGEGR
jgi:nucleoside-diphosphate-sugar epimerase